MKNDTIKARFIAEIPSAEWLAEYGYQSAQEYAYAITSDAYKDAYGIRCRWMAQATIEELAALYAECASACAAAWEAEQKAEQDAARDEQEHADIYAKILLVQSTFTLGQFWP